jgi:hypothetical protein
MTRLQKFEIIDHTNFFVDSYQATLNFIVSFFCKEDPLEDPNVYEVNCVFDFTEDQLKVGELSHKESLILTEDSVKTLVKEITEQLSNDKDLLKLINTYRVDCLEEGLD